MPGKARLQEIVKEQVYEVSQETGHLTHAASNPGEVTQEYVREHARHIREAANKAEEACIILVRESERGE